MHSCVKGVTTMEKRGEKDEENGRSKERHTLAWVVCYLPSLHFTSPESTADVMYATRLSEYLPTTRANMRFGQ